jgi:5-(carboxyamino)imidazole ribonucleotide mutase
MVASLTCLPVIGVPVQTKSMDGLDSLLSIVQMPAGVPVATVPINGGIAAGLLAARMLAIDDLSLQNRLAEFMKKSMEPIQ